MSKKINFLDKHIIESSVLTFGNFDGIHIGHDKLISTLIKKSKLVKSKSVLLTFNPHTREVINPNDNIDSITSHEIKINILNSYKLDYIVTINFDNQFKEISCDVFVDKLIEKYNPKIIIIGYDNKFGHRGMGDYRFLINYLKDKNIEIIKFPTLKVNDVAVKSSLIKRLISDGSVDQARTYLKRYFCLYGKIIKGRGVGRTIGFPTANLKMLDEKQIIPKVGVYYVNFIVDNDEYKGVCNIGNRPTFSNNDKLTIETHVVNFKRKELYNKLVKIEFIKYIRSEKKFSNKSDLINQIEKDVNVLQEIRS